MINFAMNTYQSTILMSWQNHENKYTDIPCYRGGRLKLRSLLLMKRIGSRTLGCLCSVLNSSIPDPWWFLVGRSLDGSSNLQSYTTILYYQKAFRPNSIFTNATNLIIFINNSKKFLLISLIKRSFKNNLLGAPSLAKFNQ